MLPIILLHVHTYVAFTFFIVNLLGIVLAIFMKLFLKFLQISSPVVQYRSMWNIILENVTFTELKIPIG